MSKTLYGTVTAFPVYLARSMRSNSSSMAVDVSVVVFSQHDFFGSLASEKEHFSVMSNAIILISSVPAVIETIKIHRERVA